jgi:hypothetical protein
MLNVSGLSGCIAAIVTTLRVSGPSCSKEVLMVKVRLSSAAAA